jgi:hypothetical protein
MASSKNARTPVSRTSWQGRSGRGKKRKAGERRCGKGWTKNKKDGVKDGGAQKQRTGSEQRQPQPTKPKADEKPPKCTSPGCKFFGTTRSPKCSVCGDPLRAEKYKAAKLAATKDTRRLLSWLPVPKEIDTLSKFLTYLGTKSVQLGDGEQFTKIEVDMSRKHMTIAVDLECLGEPVPLKVFKVVIHSISKEPDGDRMGDVTLSMEHPAWRVKCGWSEKADGEVVVFRY